MTKIFDRLAVLALLSLLVGCDHTTKGIAKAELEGGKSVELIGGVLDLRYVENTDIAFNLLRWIPLEIRSPALLITGAVAVLGLFTLLMFRPRSEGLAVRSAFVLLVAGAIGNYVDRVVRGYVVDFVHLHQWPVFNVADAYLVVGFLLLAWTYVSPPPPSAPA